MDDEGVVGVEQDVALLEQPEKIGGVFGWRGGCSFRENGFPETFQFGGRVFAYPFHHFAGARGEHGIGCESAWTGGAGEEFTFAFEDGHVLGFEGFANGRDKDGRVFADMIASAFESGEQPGREVLSGNSCGDVGLASEFESFVQELGSNGAFEFRAVGEPFDVGDGSGWDFFRSGGFF